MDGSLLESGKTSYGSVSKQDPNHLQQAMSRQLCKFDRFNISRNSLIVNATCNGPRRPMSLTCRTLLDDKASSAWAVIKCLTEDEVLDILYSDDSGDDLIPELDSNSDSESDNEAYRTDIIHFYSFLCPSNSFSPEFEASDLRVCESHQFEANVIALGVTEKRKSNSGIKDRCRLQGLK
ncbi:hypothetical protein C0J52_03166 [Blattella germanica]|nr:hypothetical protein C0J52_03166 [Blattella germanica]